MRSTKYFVGKHRLDQENFEFSREDFLSDLNQDFLELLNTSANNPVAITPENFPYPKFRVVVKQMEQKFWAISNKKIGQPFSKNLWSAFYAIYIVPKRDDIYPKVDKVSK